MTENRNRASNLVPLNRRENGSEAPVSFFLSGREPHLNDRRELSEKRASRVEMPELRGLVSGGAVRIPDSMMTRVQGHS